MPNIIEMHLLSLIVLAPFFSATLIMILTLIAPNLSKKIYTFLALSGAGISAILALVVGYKSYVYNTMYSEFIFRWLDIEAFKIDFALQADPLSAMMILFVAPVGFLIHIYATGYMKDDLAYGRFFALFNIFMFSMLLLVLADNPFMMFVGWEGVGVTSYALIAFYFNDRENVNAGNKAFILNRVGDFGFLSALMLLFVFIGEYGFDFNTIMLHLNEISPNMIHLIAGLLFVGAMGKSAQIPLYVWLPDAMAGPTPVSALIHAATMVTAGVYMVARFSPIYELSFFGEIITYVGAFSALLAGLIATRQNDIKKILAYSTMSQLGYMFMVAGIGGYSYALFHVFTHAFFKALLFMGAGAVIVAMHHEQDIRKMGGLKSELPLIFIMMLIGSLSLSAIAPLSGFFSKDAIMAQLFGSGHYGVYFIALATSALTAYYMFRMMFIVFFGDKKPHTHAVPKSMIFPMIILTFFSVIAGFFNVPHIFGGHEAFSSWLQLPDRHYIVSHAVEYILMAVNTLIIAAAITLAYVRFGKKDANYEESETTLGQAISNKFYVDKWYHKMIVSPLYRASRFFDKINIHFIDHFIHTVSLLYMKVSTVVRVVQNGLVHFYLIYIGAGISMLFIYLYLMLEL